MQEAYFFTIIGLVWIFGWAAVWLVRRRALDTQALKQRELLHRERLAAIDKGVPLPEIPADEEVTPSWAQPETDRVRAAWLRRAALITGWVTLLTGIGMCAGFYWAPDRSFHGMWTIGLIPAMAGIGFLIFAALTRGATTDDPS